MILRKLLCSTRTAPEEEEWHKFFMTQELVKLLNTFVVAKVSAMVFRKPHVSKRDAGNSAAVA